MYWAGKRRNLCTQKFFVFVFFIAPQNKPKNVALAGREDGFPTLIQNVCILFVSNPAWTSFDTVFLNKKKLLL